MHTVNERASKVGGSSEATEAVVSAQAGDCLRARSDGHSPRCRALPPAHLVLAGVLLAACTDRSQPADDPPYETWDDACTIWQGIEVRKMDAVDYDAVVDIIIDTRAACEFYEHDAPPECTEILWDLFACQEALDPPYTCCDEGKPCHDEFVAAQFDEGDPCSPP